MADFTITTNIFFQLSFIKRLFSGGTDRDSDLCVISLEPVGFQMCPNFQ